MNIEDLKEEKWNNEELSLADKWILTKKNRVIEEVIRNMEKYDFHNVGSALYKFIWEDFCDSYIELTKNNMNITTKQVLLNVLTTIVKLLHPFMPYVTEEIYQMLPIKDKKSIMISTYPVVKEDEKYDTESECLTSVLEDIVAIRNLKALNKITKEAFVKIECNDELRKVYTSQLKIKEEQVTNEVLKEKKQASYQSTYIHITYFFEAEKVDESALQEEIKVLEASIERREKLLANENYLNKAPSNVVELDRKKLIEEKEKLAHLKNS